MQMVLCGYITLLILICYNSSHFGVVGHNAKAVMVEGRSSESDTNCSTEMIPENGVFISVGV